VIFVGRQHIKLGHDVRHCLVNECQHKTTLLRGGWSCVNFNLNKRKCTDNEVQLRTVKGTVIDMTPMSFEIDSLIVLMLETFLHRCYFLYQINVTDFLSGII